jgi:23S rRNA (uracil1939-C5)-methyltransferase
MPKNKAKGQIIEKVLVQEIADEGRCMAKHEGLVLFIENAAPGDLVDVQLKKKRSNHAIGEAIHFHSLSSQRSTPFCVHFGTCGGCKWQHVNYETQLFYKEKQVRDALTRIAKVALPEIEPIIGSEKTQFYRNKLEFSFTNRKWLTWEEIKSGAEMDRRGVGFHVPGQFDKVLDLSECHLQAEPSNSIRMAIREYALQHELPFFDLKAQEGLLRNVMIRTTTLAETMVMLQFFENQQDEIKGLLEFLLVKFPEITSLFYVVNEKRNDTFLDQETILYHGTPYITEDLDGLKFRISPKSFFQTNSEQALLLYRVVMDFADLQGHELVYDLYCGTGTISAFLARKAQKVIGIEYVENAVEDARLNAEINQITNTHFVAGDMKKVLVPDFVAKHGKPNVIVTDPPRAGMDKEVVACILEIEPDKIVYVSCNAATQARDLALMDEKYEVVQVQPVDMFPHTSHVENVVLLQKRA